MAVLNAIQEGDTVYLLLDDGRILAKEHEDKRCAELSCEQMVRLQLPTKQLLEWFDWKVHEEAPA